MEEIKTRAGQEGQMGAQAGVGENTNKSKRGNLRTSLGGEKIPSVRAGLKHKRKHQRAP